MVKDKVRRTIEGGHTDESIFHTERSGPSSKPTDRLYMIVLYYYRIKIPDNNEMDGF